MTIHFTRYQPLLLAITFWLSMLPNPVRAAEATSQFNVNFTYTAPSCEVTNGSASILVEMGNQDVALFSSKGSQSPAKTLRLVITCQDDTPGGVQVTFSGPQASGDADLLALTGAGNEGTASGIGVALYDQKNILQPLNKAGTVVPAKKGETELDFTARYKSTQDQVSAGSADAVATFSLSYP